MLTEEQRALADACDELAAAIRERDYFYHNVDGWRGVHITGNGLEMSFADDEVREATKRACAAYVDGRVAEARERLKKAQGG